jgi:hypothetical protein
MTIAIWSSEMMDQILGVVKNEKISGGVLVLLITIAWWAHGWASGEFVKKGEFNKLQTTVTEGFASIEINDASQIIRDKKLGLTITKATQGSEEQIEALVEELQYAQAYKACLVRQEPNCQHLKDVE